MAYENIQNAHEYAPEKFQSAEQLWFWFLYSKSIRNGFSMRKTHTTRRVCELVDVETLIAKLHLAGRLTDAQLSVMKQFGDRRRAPHQYIWAENRAASQWQAAMDTIEAAARARGWIA